MPAPPSECEAFQYDIFVANSLRRKPMREQAAQGG